VARSYLYTPGDRPDRLARAERTGADAVIADLEDGVAPDVKDEARANVAQWLSTPAAGTVRFVRVNPGATLEVDIDALAASPPAGIVLPKATVAAVDLLADYLEGWSVGLSEVTALVESAEGVLELEQLAAHPLVSRVALGEADLIADLGMDPSPDDRELWPLRMRAVVASAAAGIDAPVGPVDTAFADLAGLAASTEALRRAGYGARAAIHPDQVEVINAAFTPTADAVEEAEALVDRYEQSAAAGRGVAVADDGRMIDEAVVRKARRTLRGRDATGSDQP
jgi:citrate lyase subunit beta/citryl-CoA lyase